ncbi:bifunctional lytic transglycosylase/C40 family peptidase [Bacillus sp. FSL K6-6540]|uniref:bifunctional lytic transglycosylase/C40 family peptidase n=1 Tax=Bacillus sp. FSL K6-6540 TaxID=2921512 RepID=UPI0030FA15D2
MLMKIKMALQLLGIAKKHWPAILTIVLILTMLPLFLMALISSLFSWMDWGEELDQIKLKPYYAIANEHGMPWQELLAIDLAKHDYAQDDLKPKELEDDFVWYEKITVNDYDEEGNLIGSHTETIKHVRSFEEVMSYLGFTDEQRDQAISALALLYDESGEIGGGYVGGNLPLSPNVLRYEPLVRKYAKEHGIEDYVNIILAMIQQETGGNYLDVMQCSESLGLPPNTITDPEYSIQVGVGYFADRLRQAKGDVKLALQAYNFGAKFIDYALQRGGYSKEVAIEFSEMMARQLGWSRYGDVDYVDHVLRYAGGSGGDIFEKAFAIMKSYLGMPYVFGGREPKDGGFDCSGLIEYAFGQIGIKITGRAVDQYEKTRPVNDQDAKPGDLVFFTTTEERVSHVGMYIGDGKFIQASNSGVNIASLDTWKKLYPFLGFRRIQ